MNSTELLHELDRLRTLKNKEREAELAKLMQDPFVQDVCRAALDPFVRYGVAKRFDAEPGNGAWEPSTWSLLANLQSRTVTGNAARESIHDVLVTLAPASQELLWRVLTKDLRCGAGPKTFNKAYPGFVPVFEMQTCHGYDPDRITQWPVVCETKYDGTRVACVWEDQTLTIVSRNGLPMPGFVPFAEDMQHRMHTLLDCGVDLPDMILDGEMDSAEGFYETVGGARRKNGEGEFILRLFDAVPLRAFKTGKVKSPWHFRKTIVQSLVECLAADHITYSPGQHAHTDEDVRQLFAEAREQGHEGIIVKQPDNPYECKRGYHWMKIKPKASVDVPIVDFEEGTGKNQGKLGAVVCDLESVRVRVGTGWSDDQRHTIWNDCDAYLGRMIEVEYAEKTPDGALRHPRFVRFRDDKYPEDGPGV